MNTELPFDSATYRQVLGHFPTGVAAITAISADGTPTGMAVGSFTSVSLDPPLVAFLPDKSSSTFPLIRDSGRFCVNFLTHQQEWMCRTFATKGADKFAGVTWQPATSTGSPVIDDALGWIDCEIGDIHDAGDHYIVIGAVKDLGVSGRSMPLVFFQGGFGHFSSLTLSSAFDTQLLRELKFAEAARPYVEELVEDLDLECLAMVRQGEEMLTLASWGGSRERHVPSRVGQRQPLLPPMGALLVAWNGREAIESWLDLARDDEHEKAALGAILDRVRDRGWSLGLDSAAQRRFAEAVARVAPEGPTPEQRREMVKIAQTIMTIDSEPERLRPGCLHNVRSISAPVFGPNGGVEMMLTLFGFRDMTTEEIHEQRDRLLATADQVIGAIGGRRPAPVAAR